MTPAEDDTARSLAHHAAALDAIEDIARSVLASVDQGIVVVNGHDRIVLVNPAAERILGQPAYELVGSEPAEWMRRADGAPWPADDWPVRVALRERRSVHASMRLVRGDATVRWLSTTTSPLPPAEDGRRGAVVSFSDVTERRREAERRRHTERLLAETQRLARVGSWDWRPGDGETTWTDEMYRLVGLVPRSVPVTAGLYLAFTHPDDRTGLLAAGQAALARGGEARYAHRVLLPTGEVRHLQLSGEVELDPDGEPVRAWGSAEDVTERHRAQEELRRMALTDPLTGLGNRLLLVGRLREAMVRLAQGVGCVAVIAVDLDGLKAVNDTYGHATGDELLRETAVRLRAVTREGDTVARVGGDEFVLLGEGLGAATAAAVAGRLVAELSAPYHLSGGVTAWSGASVGVTVTADPRADVDRLLADADRALYAAKGDGGNRYAVDPAAFDVVA